MDEVCSVPFNPLLAIIIELTLMGHDVTSMENFISGQPLSCSSVADIHRAGH